MTDPVPDPDPESDELPDDLVVDTDVPDPEGDKPS